MATVLFGAIVFGNKELQEAEYIDHNKHNLIDCLF